MMKRLSILVLAVVFQHVAFAQKTDVGLKYKEEIKIECQKVMDDFEKGEVLAAFEKLKFMWVFPSSELDDLEVQTIKQLKEVNSRFGEIIGTKFVQEKEIEDLLYRLTYVLKYEKHALRFYFGFYNGKDGKWYLSHFKYNDTLSELFND